jgi:hypothetical protein
MATTTNRAGANPHSAQVKLICVLAANVPFSALVLWGTVTLGKNHIVKSGGAAEMVAAVVGMLHISFGLTAAAIRASGYFIHDTDESDELRRQGRALLLGAGALVAAGSSLILLSLAGPGRLVPPTFGLVLVMLLTILATVLVAIRLRLLDELDRAVARESGYLAFGWFSMVGGTWAILTHLGFVATPTPLNWLTMIYGFSLVAGIIASAHRGGFDNGDR